MDKRFKGRDHDQSIKDLDDFHQKIRVQEISLSDAVKTMQKITRLTQKEFAEDRGYPSQH